MKSFVLFNFLISVHYALCRDFYVGMFRRNDFLVAQDNLYKERRPYAFVQAEYGRLFKCPITYFRVVDRLGVGSGPTVKVIRGGLRKKYIAVRIKSGYGLPVSVNIYVGCENLHKRTPIRPWKITTTAADDAASDTTDDEAESTTIRLMNLDNADDDNTDATDGDDDATTPAADGDSDATDGDATTAAEGEGEETEEPAAEEDAET